MGAADRLPGSRRMGARSALTQESCMAMKTKGVTRVPGRESKRNAKTTAQLQVYDVQSQVQLNNTLSRNCSWVAELARRSKEWLLQKQNSLGGQGTQGTSVVITFYSLTWRKGTYMFIVSFCCVCVYLFNICLLGTSLAVWCLRLCVFPMQGMWVPSLFGEPRSHLPSGMAKKKKKVFCVIYFAINIRQKEKKNYGMLHSC